jgi:hypothetical protein
MSGPRVDDAAKSAQLDEWLAQVRRDEARRNERLGSQEACLARSRHLYDDDMTKAAQHWLAENHVWSRTGALRRAGL